MAAEPTSKVPVIKVVPVETVTEQQQEQKSLTKKQRKKIANKAKQNPSGTGKKGKRQSKNNNSQVKMQLPSVNDDSSNPPIIIFGKDEEETSLIDQETGEDLHAVEIEMSDPQSQYLSVLEIFFKISKMAIAMGLGFTFSAEVVLIIFLIHHISSSEEENAASALISTLLNGVMYLAMSPLFSIYTWMSPKIGEWRAINAEIAAIEVALRTENLPKLFTKNEMQEQQENILKNMRNELEKLQSQKPVIEKMIGATFGNGLIIATVTAVPAFLTLFFSKSLLTNIFRQDEEISASVQDFLRLYAILGAPLSLEMRMLIEQLFYSASKVSLVAIIALISFAISSSVAALAGFGLDIDAINLHIPALGIHGLAIGFSSEASLTAALLGIYLAFSKENRQFGFFKQLLRKTKNSWSQLKELLKIAVAIFSTATMDIIMSLAVGALSGVVSTQAQAAMALNLQYIFFATLLFAAFGFTCAQEFGRELGEKRFNNASRVARIGLLTTLAYVMPLPTIFAIKPSWLIAILNGASQEVATIADYLVFIMVIGLFFEAIKFYITQQLRVLGDLTIPNIMILLGLASGIGLSAFLGLATEMGVHGIGIGYASGMALPTLLMLPRWLYKTQPQQMKRMAEIKEQENEAKAKALEEAEVQRSQTGDLTLTTIDQSNNSDKREKSFFSSVLTVFGVSNKSIEKSALLPKPNPNADTPVPGIGSDLANYSPV